MEKQIEDFYRSLRGRRVAFIGTGVTNQQCIELFARCGAQITLCDKKPNAASFGAYGETLKKLGVRLWPVCPGAAQAGHPVFAGRALPRRAGGTGDDHAHAGL